MRGRNCFGQPRPDVDQVSVEEAQWRARPYAADDFERTSGFLGPNWTVRYYGTGFGMRAGKGPLMPPSQIAVWTA